MKAESLLGEALNQRAHVCAASPAPPTAGHVHPVPMPRTALALLGLSLVLLSQRGSSLRSRFQGAALKPAFKHTGSERVFSLLSLCYANGTNSRFVCFKPGGSWALTVGSVKLLPGTFEARALFSPRGRAQVRVTACGLQGSASSPSQRRSLEVLCALFWAEKKSMK